MGDCQAQISRNGFDNRKNLPIFAPAKAKKEVWVSG
jgi:hypothetical protein